MRHTQQIRLSVATVACLFGACKADLPGLDDEGIASDSACQTSADLLINFLDSAGRDISAEAQVVLDAPDEQSVAVAIDGVLSVGFIGLGGVLNSADRDDIRIRATGSDDVRAAVYAGFELERMHYIGEVNKDDLDLDLACGSVSAALYVRLVGLQGTLSVDAFEAVRQGCESFEAASPPTCP